MKLRNKKTGEVVEVDFEKIYKSIKGTRASYNTDWNNWHREKYGHAPDCPAPDCPKSISRPEDVLEKFSYNSLAELNAEWEDVPEEPKGYWFITDTGQICNRLRDSGESWDNLRKETGNYFETEEEAEKAVEKLKAFKRLKDKGFRFDGYKTVNDKIKFFADSNKCDPVELAILVNLLFGDE